MTLPVDQQSLLIIGAAAIVLLLSMLALLFGWLYFSQRRLLQQQNEDWLHERGQLNQQLHDAQQKQQHQSQLLAQQHSQFMVAKSQLEASQQQLQQSQNQVQQQQQQSNTLQEQRQQLQLKLQQQQIINEQQQSHYQQQIELLEQTKTRLSQEFELLANKIFEQKQAQSSAHNKEQIAHLLAPFAQQLHEFKAKVDATHLNDSKDRSALLTEIKHLQSLNQRITEEASKLTSALKGEKKLQGNWGELILETVLERSGLRRGHEYQREVSIKNDAGKVYRPDVVLYLPDNKHIIVDAKVSLNAYSRCVNASNDAEQTLALAEHIRAIRNHIDTLAQKDYQHLPGLTSPDMVFLFMPIEPAFMLAFAEDEQLFNYAFDKKIVVVTPTTLLASLKTVANLWVVERQNQHAQVLADKASKMYDKLRIFAEHMEALGERLGKSQDSYANAMNVLKTGRGNLISQASQFESLGVQIKKRLPDALIESSELEPMSLND